MDSPLSAQTIYQAVTEFERGGDCAFCDHSCSSSRYLCLCRKFHFTTVCGTCMYVLRTPPCTFKCRCGQPWTSSIDRRGKAFDLKETKEEETVEEKIRKAKLSIRKPYSAFLLFAKDHRATLGSHLTFSEKSKQTALAWRNLKAEIQAVYHARAQQEHQEYQEKVDVITKRFRKPEKQEEEEEEDGENNKKRFRPQSPRTNVV